MKLDAVISECSNYRYELSREWGNDPRMVLFIALNPSKADANIDDATSKRCINFARKWGYDKLKIANLFAYRATSPIDMMSQDEPIGYENNEHLKQMIKQSDLIVACWGNKGTYMNRHNEVHDLLKPFENKVKCFGLTANGQPKHPGRLASETQLENYIF